MDDRKPRPPNGDKPRQPPGISAAEAQQLRSRIEKLEKTIQEHLSEKNQWNSLVREWVKSRVSIHLTTGDDLTGELLWVDRYTLCLKAVFQEEDQPSSREEKTVIVHKAAVAFMYQEGSIASA